RLVLIILFVGIFLLSFRVSPFDLGLWPYNAVHFLLIGYAGFFGMDAMGRRGIALVSLMAGFMAFLCAEPAGWPWAVHLSLLACCLKSLGMISVRQLLYAMTLCLFIGFTGSYTLAAGRPGAAMASLIVGLVGILVIVTFRELPGGTPVRTSRAGSHL